MNKNLISLAVTITLASNIAAFAASSNSYTDINGNWAQSDITNLTNLQVIKPSSDGMFHPDAWVSRADFSEMAAKTLGLAPQKADSVPGLKNISQNYWGFEKVDNQAWISAYPAGVFRPADPVRRVEVLAGLAQSLNKPLVSEAEATTILSKFTDAADVPSTARREVATAVQYNLFEIDAKSGGTVIEPLRPATKAEVAALLNDLYENKNIALVQNGEVISQTSPTASTTESMTSATPSPSIASSSQDPTALSSTPSSGTSMSSATGQQQPSADASSLSSTPSSSTQSSTTNSMIGMGGNTATTGTAQVSGAPESTETNAADATMPGTTGAAASSTESTTTEQGATTTTTEQGAAAATGTAPATTAETTMTPDQQTSATSINTTSTSTTQETVNPFRDVPASYRYSTSTIPEFNRVNGTNTPSNLEAANAASIPENTTFTGTVAKALYSEFNKPGDQVMVILDHALMDPSGRVVAPAGSKVLGVVSTVVSRNATNDDAQLGIDFKEFVTPTGQRLPINATIANGDGILKGGQLQGVVMHPGHSTEALKREISTAQGGLYGTSAGKAMVLDQPYVQQLSDQPVDPMDKRSNDIILGVGDRLQLKVGTAVPNTTAAPENNATPSTNTTPAQ